MKSSKFELETKVGRSGDIDKPKMQGWCTGPFTRVPLQTHLHPRVEHTKGKGFLPLEDNQKHVTDF